MMTTALLGSAMLLQPAAPPVTATVTFQGPTQTIGKTRVPMVRVGMLLRGTLKVTLPDGFHAYQNPAKYDTEIPIRLEVVEKGIHLGNVKYPEGVDWTMPGSPGPTLVVKDTFEIPFTLRSTQPSPPNATTPVTLRFHYQLCNDTICLPPSSVQVKTAIRVERRASR